MDEQHEQEQQAPEAQPSVDELRQALAERERELAKRSKDLERLEKIAAKYDASVKGEEDRKRKAAEEQGEWRRLHDEAEARASAVEAEKAALAERLSGYEEHLREQVNASLQAIEDAEARKRISAAIDGLEPMRAHAVVAAMLAAMPESGPRAIKAGAAGRPRAHAPNASDLAERSAKGEQLRLHATLAALRQRGVVGGER